VAQKVFNFGSVLISMTSFIINSRNNQCNSIKDISKSAKTT